VWGIKGFVRQGAGTSWTRGRHCSALFGLFRDMCLIGFSKNVLWEREKKIYFIWKNVKILFSSDFLI
jgi:hypothetical protein